MDTFRAQSITAEKKSAPVRAGGAPAKDPGPASGPSGPLTRPREPFQCTLAHRVSASGETHVCQPSEGNRTNRAVNAHVSWFDRVCLDPHVQKLSYVCGPYFFASLNSLAPTRTLVTSTGYMHGQKSFPERPCMLRQHLCHNSVLRA